MPAARRFVPQGGLLPMEARMHPSPPGIPQKKNAGFTDDGRFRNTIESGSSGERFPGIAGGGRVGSGANFRERKEAPVRATSMGEA